MNRVQTSLVYVLGERKGERGREGGREGGLTEDNIIEHDARDEAGCGVGPQQQVAEEGDEDGGQDLGGGREGGREGD